MLLIGFAGAFRRSELVALQVRDIQQARSKLCAAHARMGLEQFDNGEDACGRMVHAAPRSQCKINARLGRIIA
jgi:hypothetical protein